MFRARRRITAVLIGITMCLVLQATDVAARQSGSKSVSLVLDWTLNSDHGGLVVAMRDGIFAREGLTVHPFVPSSSTSQIQLVAAGRADFGISYESDLLAARAQHIPVQAVMCIVQHPLNTVLSLASQRITRPRDLQGKTIGMAGSPTDIPLIRALVTHDGGSLKRVRLVNVNYDLLTALLAKKVDAVMDVYWTWEAIEARMKGYRVNVLRVERWGVPNYCELVLIANDSTIRQRPALVRAVVQGLQQGYALAAARPLQAWAALHAQDRTLDGRLVIASLRLLSPDFAGARTVGWQDPAQWSRYEKWLWSNHLIAHPVSASSAFTNAFLRSGIK